MLQMWINLKFWDGCGFNPLTCQLSSILPLFFVFSAPERIYLAYCSDVCQRLGGFLFHRILDPSHCPALCSSNAAAFCSHWTRANPFFFPGFYFTLLQWQQFGIALSTHYLTAILMIYLFISCYRLLRLPQRTQGMGSEREAKTEGCRSN